MLKEIKNELIKALSLLKNEKFDDSESNPTSLDATAVQISERQVGGKVELINSDGTLSVAPDGEYILSDGFHFIVKDGLIASIVDDSSDTSDEGMADDENTGGDSADAAPEGSTDDVDVQKAVADNSQAIAELQKEVAEIKALIQGLQGSVSTAASKQDVEGFKSEVVKLNETIIKLAKLPVEQTKVNKSTSAKDKADAKIMDFIKTIKKEHN